MNFSKFLLSEFKPIKPINCFYRFYLCHIFYLSKNRGQTTFIFEAISALVSIFASLIMWKQKSINNQKETQIRKSKHE
ncbi:hypothetical protein BGP_2791 [Beggiatoa sp. PS]|nr:hypothetical protein BGP_2791 [Beggiatoa sp. PS]